MEVPAGYVLVRYNGGKAGDMTKLGGGGRIYRYNATSPLFLVKEEDLMIFSSVAFSVVSVVKAEEQAVLIAAPEPLSATVPEGNDDLTQIKGITEEFQNALYELKINSYQRLVATPDAELAEVIGKKLVKSVKAAAMEILKSAAGV